MTVSLEEADHQLFALLRLPLCQGCSARTTDAIERLHGEFKRHIKTQTLLSSTETAVMLFRALMTSGQITMRKVDGWQTSQTSSTALYRLTKLPDSSRPQSAGDKSVKQFLPYSMAPDKNLESSL